VNPKDCALNYPRHDTALIAGTRAIGVSVVSYWLSVASRTVTFRIRFSSDSFNLRLADDVSNIRRPALEKPRQCDRNPMKSQPGAFSGKLRCLQLLTSSQFEEAARMAGSEYLKGNANNPFWLTK
jgi:hypothetical protein